MKSTTFLLIALVIVMAFVCYAGSSRADTKPHYVTDFTFYTFNFKTKNTTTYSPNMENNIALPANSPWVCTKYPVKEKDGKYMGNFVCVSGRAFSVSRATCSATKEGSDIGDLVVYSVGDEDVGLYVSCNTYIVP